MNILHRFFPRRYPPPAMGPGWDGQPEALREYMTAEAMKSIVEQRDALQAEVNRLRLAVKRRDGMIATLNDEYD